MAVMSIPERDPIILGGYSTADYDLDDFPQFGALVDYADKHGLKLGEAILTLVSLGLSSKEAR